MSLSKIVLHVLPTISYISFSVNLGLHYVQNKVKVV